jgi:3-oxoacyl-[acyl-carrier protein] reductase
MTDRYQQLINTPVGQLVAKQVGLPNPPKLERYERGQPVISGPVLLGASAGSRVAGALARVLASIGADVSTPMDEQLRDAAADANLDAGIWNPDATTADQRFKALVFDATGIESSEQLNQAWAFLHPTIRRVLTCGRVIVVGTAPKDCESPAQAIAQRALEGLVRAIGKEVKKGATAQLVYAAPGAGSEIESTLRFFLSPRSAFVSGQVVRISELHELPETVDWDRPLAGKVALVTGASRGIGAAIAQVLARDGAQVVGLDVAAQSSELTAGMTEIGGSELTADITDPDAPSQIAGHLLERHGGVDIVVHNAGVTRDRTLGRMTEDQWSTVIDINLIAPQRIDRELFARKAVREHGRIVCVSSINGIAGNAGQTNYSTSKAGVIGIVQQFAPVLAERSVTLNAVAPGFIETAMTDAMPIAIREAGRRMNSLSQGGLPIDVAETVAWFASPGSAGVTGNIVRVCGQSLIGA